MIFPGIAFYYGNNYIIHVPITAIKFCTEQVNLYDAHKRKLKALSGGMRRHLSVAMACIGSPDILILDEPTTGLDPASLPLSPSLSLSDSDYLCYGGG